ncbi:MAG: hypothetical protein V3V14_02530 [Saprospiraceae bacterium]
MIFTLCSVGQSDFKKLSDEEVNSLKEIVKYEETKGKLVNRKFNIKTPQKNMPSKIGGLGSGLLNMVLYLIIALLVIGLIFVVFSNIKLDKKVSKIEKDPNLSDEEIDEIDVDKGLKDALVAQDYRMAIRMLFIRLLQHLVKEKSIIWKLKKTNRDYLNEMVEHKNYSKFRTLVMAYDNVWYGSQPIDKIYYDFLKIEFDSFYSNTQKISNG